VLELHSVVVVLIITVVNDLDVELEITEADVADIEI
jgi:hypothetical protein